MSWPGTVTSNRGYEIEHIREPRLFILRIATIALEVFDQFALLRHIE